MEDPPSSRRSDHDAAADRVDAGGLAPSAQLAIGIGRRTHPRKRGVAIVLLVAARDHHHRKSPDPLSGDTAALFDRRVTGWGGGSASRRRRRDALLVVDSRPIATQGDLRTFRIRVIRDPATGTHKQYQGVLMMNPGGPGSSGVKMVANETIDDSAAGCNSASASAIAAPRAPRGSRRPQAGDAAKAAATTSNPTPTASPTTHSNRRWVAAKRSILTPTTSSVRGPQPQLNP